MHLNDIPRFTYTTSACPDPVLSSSTWTDILTPEFLAQQGAQKTPDSPTWWLDVRDATEQDVEVLSQALNIHPLTAEDIATRETREKVEVFRNYYLISFQTLVTFLDEEKHEPGEKVPPITSKTPASAVFFILVFNTGTVTFSPSGCSHVTRVRDRLRRLHDETILSSDWICYALIDDIVDSFEPYRQSAELESESIEDSVFIARFDDVKSLIPRIDNLRKRITHLIRCLTGKLDVLNGFVKRCQAKDKNPVFPDGDFILYLGDVQDHLVTTLQSLTHFDEIVSRSQSNCLAQLSANNLRLSLNINSVLSKVTVLATIFVPMHLVTGLFGMNVEVPGQEVHGLGWFFGIVGGFVAFMTIACLGAWRYKLL
ncbi:cora family metal ion transporter [Aspergillus steynii IBT 23096]|uniref:Cora family metal ion transporter n=1 Tax=Aspergillus steynii IBT 23096 TaxID=1392250 RepID=A0A2I2G7J6_9EURO|nr:cora family metal ion transporter [Aspergillus steynii IBT 23096]PLB48841.1 cora family metal ion transporter [Aspergillus steynii IBT 23096]